MYIIGTTQHTFDQSTLVYFYFHIFKGEIIISIKKIKRSTLVLV